MQHYSVFVSQRGHGSIEVVALNSTALLSVVSVMPSMDANIYQSGGYVFSLRNVEGIWNLFIRSDLVTLAAEILPMIA